jgi:hypothetical protein
MLLGDRIDIKNRAIKDGVIVVTFAVRKPDEPMSVTPSVETVRHLIMKDSTLTALSPLEAEEQVLRGLVTIGHEVRTFRPCSGGNALWLLGDSPALSEIMQAYRQALPSSKPYTPVLMILAGKYATAPPEGFGAEYGGAFFATQFVRLAEKRLGN